MKLLEKPNKQHRFFSILSIMVIVSACSSGGVDQTQQLAAATPEYHSLPGINYTRFEESETGITFASESTDGFTASSANSDAVNIDWNDTQDAVLYRVYRRESTPNLLDDGLCSDDSSLVEEGYIQLAEVNSSSFLDENASSTNRNEYIISAVNSLQETRTIATGLIVSVDEAKRILEVKREEENSTDLTNSIPTVSTDQAAAISSPDLSVGNGNTTTDSEGNNESSGQEPVSGCGVATEQEVQGTEYAPIVIPVSSNSGSTTPTDNKQEPQSSSNASSQTTDTASSSTSKEPIDETDEVQPTIPTVDTSAQTAPTTPPTQILPPMITIPTNGSTLEGSTVRLAWDANDTIVREWWVRAGSSAGANNYFDSGRLSDPETRAVTVSNLPTNGTSVHLQLSFKQSNGSWGATQFQYTAATATPEPTLGAANTNSDWDNTVSPPTLSDPLIIEISTDYPTTAIPDFDRVECEGLIHQINVQDNQDVLVTMAPGSGPLIYPVWVTGGRHLHIRGLEMRTVVQDGCDVGEATQMRDPRPNIHPRLPGGKVFRLEQSGITFIEGVDIDLKGQEADCFVMRNPNSMSMNDALRDRHFYIVNTRCTGIEGLDDSPIGDGIHGDFFQNQGGDNLGTFTVENVSFRTSSNGITLHAWNGTAGIPTLFRLRNMDYGWDLRYDDDDPYEISGLAYSAHGHNLDFENVYLNHPRNGNYGFLNGERVGAISRGNGYITQADGIYEGTPPGGDYATEEETGIEYVSPF